MNPESAVQQLFEPLYRAKGWMKFAGVLSIIQGILSIFSIWGILVCWIPIWLGAVLCSASNQLRVAFETDDPAAAHVSMDKLATYFRIMGVLTVITLVIALLALFAAILIPAVVKAKQIAGR